MSDGRTQEVVLMGGPHAGRIIVVAPWDKFVEMPWAPPIEIAWPIREDYGVARLERHLYARGGRGDCSFFTWVRRMS